MERRINLEALVQAIFQRAGPGPVEAAILARHLVLASLLGRASHGSIRLAN